MKEAVEILEFYAMTYDGGKMAIDYLANPDSPPSDQTPTQSVQFS